MSSRQLRKLQQQREAEKAKLELSAPPSDDESVEEEELFQGSKPKPSLFASFAALEDEDQGEDEDEIDTVASVPKDVDFHHDSSAADGEAAAIPAKKPKKSKKKKKAKSKPNEKGSNHDAAIDNKSDDIDAALRELDLKARKNGTKVEDITPKLDPEYERVCKLLGINTQNLKVANEMRNLFGSTATENHDEAGGRVPGRRGGRRQRVQQQVDLETALKGNHLPGKGLPELTLRRNIFIQGKEEWPRATTGGLTMEVVEDKSALDDTVEYRFVHDQAYNNLQQQFDMLVEMGEPQNLIGLLQRNPYHVSLLLQVSKIAKDQSDHALSSDLVERALFTFARASLTQFSAKLAQGKARLDFARPENRELWLAGYQYIKSLVMKGTYRTAFEWAKLLLSLDPEDDPYCMRLMVHHLALRSHEYKWLLEYGETELFQNSKVATHATPSLAFAAMQLKQGAKCRELLAKDIQRIPWLFCKLFQDLNLSDPPPSVWGMTARTAAEELFTDLYIKQTRDLWNAPEATSLLVEVAHATDKLPEAEIQTSTAEITLDVARFVYLDNTPALMSIVPPKLMHRQPNSDSDPLPPDDNTFSWPSQRRPFEGRSSGDGAFAGYTSPLNAIRNLLPFGNRDVNGDQEEEDINEDVLREQLGQRLTEEETNAILGVTGGGDGPAQEPGLLSRALATLFGFTGSRGAREDPSDTETEDEDEDDQSVADGRDHQAPH